MRTKTVGHAVGDRRAAAMPAVPAQSVWWSGAGIATSQLTRMLVATVLARVLGPTAFAPVAVAAIYMTIVALLLDMGLVAAVIQRPHLAPRHLRVAAAANLVTGCAVWAVSAGAIGLGLAASWSRTTAIFFLLLSFAPLIRSVGLLSQARLYRARHQAFLGRLEVFGALAGLTCALVAVASGAGLWSYLLQVLVTEICLCAGWIRRCRPFIRPRWDRLAFRELWGFGSKSMGSDVLTVATRNVDSLALGWLSSGSQLSLYAVAYRFLITPIQFFGQLTVRVALPELSDLHRRSEPVGPVVIAYTRRLSVAIWPIMGLAVCLAPRTVSIVLGNSWLPVVPVVQALCVAGAFQTSLAMMAPAMLAVGAVRASLKYALSLFIVSSLVYLLTAGQGAAVVAVGCAVVSSVFAVLLCCLASRVLGTAPATTVTAVLSGIALFGAVVIPAWLAYTLVPQSASGRLLAEAIAVLSAAAVLVVPRVRNRLADSSRQSREAAEERPGTGGDPPTADRHAGPDATGTPIGSVGARGRSPAPDPWPKDP